MSEATVRIYESELSLIVHETAEYETIETGGSLFGLWTNSCNPTIMLASRPGKQAIRTATQFEQEVDIHRLMEELMVRHHGVQSVGLWHSHHGLGLHELSGGDVRRTMKFAHRTKRRLFCDLLCYFAKHSRGAKESPEVTVKPYVYHDAASGRRLPTSIAVLPGLSPLRSALFEQGLKRDVEERLRFALASPPKRWQPRFQIARSAGLAQDGEEDRSVSSAGSKPEVRNAIPNLDDYIHNYLEPELRDIPRIGITCELEPIFDDQALRMTLISADRSVEHELDLGWDGAQPVVTRFVARAAQQPAAKKLMGDGEVRGMSKILRSSVKSLGKFKNRR
jgi:hypothetical protein